MNRGKNDQIRLLNLKVTSLEEEIKILKQALSESQSVSDNETKEKLCVFSNSCYRPEKMKHDKECTKYCEEFKAK